MKLDSIIDSDCLYSFVYFNEKKLINYSAEMINFGHTDI